MCGVKVVATELLGRQGLGEWVHVVYALSKDFGLSGLRVGAVYPLPATMRVELIGHFKPCMT